MVERGKADGLYVVTAGVGMVKSPTPVCPKSVRVGDMILLSGDLGRHGAAVLAVREVPPLTHFLIGANQFSFYAAWGGWLSLIGFAAVAYALIGVPVRKRVRL